jgi:arylsulfatase A-like enzyme
VSKRPNIIVFLTDQQRFDSTGLHGNPLELTPNLDRVAQRGTRLRYCFTPQPVCGPARACLQTGMYASQNGCVINGIALPHDRPTLARCFREAGYRTAYIGKWHLGRPENDGAVVPEDRGGYEDWLAANVMEFVSQPFDCVLFDADGQRRKLPGYRVDACVDAAIDYIAGRAGDERPFFLFFSILEPHHQNEIDDYPAPPGYRERYAGRWTPPDLASLGGSSAQHLGGYWGIIKRIDEAYGRLLDALRSLGMLDDTVVLFTADHGCHFKTRNVEYKRSCHESSIRVPAVITGPGFNGGGDVDALVSLIDVPPTLLRCAGIEPPETMVGRAVQDLLERKAPDWSDEVFVQISEDHIGRAIRTKRWKYAIHAPGADPWAAAPIPDAFEELCLYDLEADPYELNNLIHHPRYRPIADEMRQRLLRRMEAVGEKVPQVAPPRAK